MLRLKSKELASQNQPQRHLKSIAFHFLTLEACLNSCQPIAPKIIMKGIAGKINLSCLLLKAECKKIKSNKLNIESKYFFCYFYYAASKKQTCWKNKSNQ